MDTSSLSSWQGALLVVLSSGLVAAITNSIMQWIKEARTKAADREIAAATEAIFLIRELDALAVQCANNIWEHYEIFNQIAGTADAGKYPGAVKPAFELTREAASKIDKAVATKIAWLDTEFRLGKDLIRSAWFHDILDYHEAHDQQANLVGYFGHRALEAAADLRRKYHLGENQNKWGMSGVVELLKKSAGEAEKYLSKSD